MWIIHVLLCLTNVPVNACTAQTAIAATEIHGVFGIDSDTSVQKRMEALSHVKTPDGTYIKFWPETRDRV